MYIHIAGQKNCKTPFLMSCVMWLVSYRYYNKSPQNNTNLLCYISGSQKSKMGLKSRYQQVYVPPGCSNGEFSSLTLLASKGHLNSLALPFFFKSQPYGIFTSLPLILTFLLPSKMGISLVITLEPWNYLE